MNNQIITDNVQERLQQNFFGFLNFLSETKPNPSNTPSTSSSSSLFPNPSILLPTMSPSLPENNQFSLIHQESTSKLLMPSPHKKEEETSLPLQIIDSISNSRPTQNFKVEPLVQKQEEVREQFDLLQISENEFSPSVSQSDDTFQMFCTFKYGPMSINKFGSKSKVPSVVLQNATIEYLQENSKFHFEDFKIEKLLGRGSSAEVYKVKHIPTNDTYALKVVHPHITISNPLSILVEYKALLDCNCEQVVKLHEVFYIEGSIHMVLDYMNCGSLQNIIEFCKVVPEAVIAKMAKQILKGLAYIHSRSIIHRDIKPQNILVHYDSKQGARLKIGDFGTAGQKDLLSSPKQSLFSTFSGSFQYMAPERIDCKNYSYNSDIWSLGLVVLELATGSFPFKNKDFVSVANKLDHFSVELPSHLSPQCKHFILDCLQIDVTKRPNAATLLKYDFIKQNNKTDPSIGKYIYYEYIKKKKSQAFERKFVRELTRNSSMTSFK